MNSSAFLLFPPELIQDIGEELGANDVKNLRLTCKQFEKVLGPLIRRKVTINLNQSTIYRGIPKLRAFASKESEASKDTRDLTIHALSPIFDPKYSRDWMNTTPEIPPKALQAEEELKLTLLNSLTSLRGVRKLRWSPICEDKQWVQTTVANALKDLPNLRVLELDLTYGKVAINLEELRGLHSFSIENNSGGEIYEQTLRSLPKLIARSPLLTSIDLLTCGRWQKATPQIHSLHHLFQHYPKNIPPLCLAHIGLHNCFFRLDNTTIPHLLFLKSLRLTSLADPFTHYSEFNEDGGEQNNENGSSAACDIWKALGSVGVRPEVIKHDSLSPSFLSYISTYSGLTKLDLEPDSGRVRAEITDPLAVRFFADCLPNHVQTLEELYIKPRFEGAWSFRLHAMASVSKCVNLKKLGASIIYADLEDKVDGSEEPMKVDAIKSLIDMVVVHMPKLEALTIFSADLEFLRGAICGTSSVDHFYRTQFAMIDSIERYIAPNYCRKLPRLKISPGSSEEREETFTGQREDRPWASRLVYKSDRVDDSRLSES